MTDERDIDIQHLPYERPDLVPVIYMATLEEWQEARGWLNEQPQLPLALARLERVLDYMTVRPEPRQPKYTWHLRATTPPFECETTEPEATA